MHPPAPTPPPTHPPTPITIWNILKKHRVSRIRNRQVTLKNELVFRVKLLDAVFYAMVNSIIFVIGASLVIFKATIFTHATFVGEFQGSTRIYITKLAIYRWNCNFDTPFLLHPVAEIIARSIFFCKNVHILLLVSLLATLCILLIGVVYIWKAAKYKRFGVWCVEIGCEMSKLWLFYWTYSISTKWQKYHQICIGHGLPQGPGEPSFPNSIK